MTSEAIVLAERQAFLLLAICGIDRLPVPVEMIGELSAVHVQSYGRLPVAGASFWNGATWVVVLDGRQCDAHLRMTLAHEFKHVIDGGTKRRYEDDDVAEPIADFFARCLLIPRPWLKSVLAQGARTVDALAEDFGVPTDVMQLRLHEVGLAGAVRAGRFRRRRKSRCRRRVCQR